MIRDEMTYELIRFDRSIAAPVGALAAMHAELLPTSPLVKLGTPFLERFYYSVLPPAGVLFGTVARVNGRSAGFVAATDDSGRFVKNALRGRWLPATWAAASSLVATAGRIATIIEVLRLALARTYVDRCEAQGEILSLAVRHEFLGQRFAAHSGLHIAHDLVGDAIDRLRAQGNAKVRAVVDADNLAARFFFCGLGWTLARSAVPGWRAPSVEYVMDL